MKKHGIELRFIPVFLLLVFSIGCATSAEIKDVQLKPTFNIAASQKTKPIQFKKIVVKIDSGTHVGALQTGLMCLAHSNLTWKGERLALSEDDFTNAFREELEKNNYQVVGNPNALFEDPSEWKAEFLVAGVINELRINICFPYLTVLNFSSTKGEAYMKVNWQVYSRLDRKAVYETTTEGSYRSSETVADGGTSVWRNAFGMSIRNLLSDKGFYELVAESPGL